jgi:high-affinity K+ transport system ATPase subunit B
LECKGPYGQCGDMDDFPIDKYGTLATQRRTCVEVRPAGQSCTYNAECTLPDEIRHVFVGCGC